MMDAHVHVWTALALIGEHATFLSQDDREQILRRTAEDFFFGRRRPGG